MERNMKELILQFDTARIFFAEEEEEEEEEEASIVVSLKDITERKKAEKELRESEEKFRRLFESNPEALLYVDKNFKIADINPRFKELFGYSLREIKGRYLNDPIVPENKKDEARKLDEMSKKGYTFHETVRKKKDGTLVPVSISAAPVISEGSIVGITVTYKDITKRKETEKKLSTIYDLSREMTLSLDLDQISKLVLDATEKVLKFGNVDLFLIDEEKNELRLKEARGLKETERYTVIPLYGEKGISAHVARTGKSLIVPDVRKDERYLFGLKDSRSELCAPIKIKDRIIGVIDVESKELNAFSEEDQKLLENLASQAAIAIENARLFREEKKAKEQREKARKEAEFYSDLLGHDIGNLNQVILGYLYLLQNAEDEETRKKNVEGIKKSIMKSKRLAESIRTLKIIKDTKIEKFDLNKSIERSIENIKEYFDREIEVNLNIKKEYHVKANDFLDKVFFNILENSVEYTFHDPVIIDIKTEEKDDFCNIYIHDNGIGIPKEKREDILRNLETLSKRTGIGLYLTKKILDRFDGKFEIKDVEKGTEIVISIPVIS
ncbi:MAG TPA: PAS domain S-box protein [Thermoplasmata archaeon]|nr:PAS domain S-box protein [Thermoplasmata archaeon]